MKHRPIVLIFLRWYLPGFKSGGPVRSVANFVDALGSDFNFYIVTSDRDSGDIEPYEGVKKDRWVQVGKANVFYASASKLSIIGIFKLIKNTRHDVLYLNSFFDINFALYPMLYYKFLFQKQIQIVISQRGEFSSGALKIFPIKKKLFIKLMIFLGIFKNSLWHATSEIEAEDIKRTIGIKKNRILVARNLPDKRINLNKSFNNTQNNFNRTPIRLVFLSLISFKKNLDYALNILKKLDLPIIFDIYGVIEDEKYWKFCQKKMLEMPDNVLVSYKGIVPHKDVINILSSYDLFFFPTQGENYGHVIAEAMIAGLPVLISDQTPWNEIDNLNVGFVKQLENQDGFIKSLQNFFLMSAFDRKQLFDRIDAYVQSSVFNKNDIEEHKKLFILKNDN